MLVGLENVLPEARPWRDTDGQANVHCPLFDTPRAEWQGVDKSLVLVRGERVASMSARMVLVLNNHPLIGNAGLCRGDLSLELRDLTLEIRDIWGTADQRPSKRLNNHMLLLARNFRFIGNSRSLRPISLGKPQSSDFSPRVQFRRYSSPYCEIELRD